MIMVRGPVRIIKSEELIINVGQLKQVHQFDWNRYPRTELIKSTLKTPGWSWATQKLKISVDPLFEVRNKSFISSARLRR